MRCAAVSFKLPFRARAPPLTPRRSDRVRLRHRGKLFIISDDHAWRTLLSSFYVPRYTRAPFGLWPPARIPSQRLFSSALALFNSISTARHSPMCAVNRYESSLLQKSLFICYYIFFVYFLLRHLHYCCCHKSAAKLAMTFSLYKPNSVMVFRVTVDF